MGLGSVVSAAAAVSLAAMALVAALPVEARDAPSAALPSVALSQLPDEARTTYRLIHEGGPFPFRKDGVVFGNRERLLPARPRGHYHEYTVPTPRSRDRGARRIVCAGTRPVQPEACFYTSDHYASFSRIVE
jgi:ribonuclease T1